MVLLHHDDIGHKVAVVDLYVEPVRDLSEAVADVVLALHHHPHHRARLSLRVDPVGDHRLVAAGAFLLLQDAHEEVGHAYEGGGVFEDLLVVGVVVDVGDADRTHGDDMVALHDVFGLRDHDL